MKKRLPVWRILAVLISIGVILLGFSFLSEARSIEQRFEKQSATLPLDMPIDLSEPGKFSAPLKQTWQACHGQSITLRLLNHEINSSTTEHYFESLDLEWHVTDASGAVVAEGKASDFTMRDKRFEDGQIDLGNMYPFELGDYTFTCLVTSGEPSLAGIEQRLISEYRPCGMELMPAAMIKFVGICALILGGTVLVPLILMTAADVFNQSKANAVASDQKAGK